MKKIMKKILELIISVALMAMIIRSVFKDQSFILLGM